MIRKIFNVDNKVAKVSNYFFFTLMLFSLMLILNLVIAKGVTGDEFVINLVMFIVYFVFSGLILYLTNTKMKIYGNEYPTSRNVLNLLFMIYTLGIVLMLTTIILNYLLKDNLSVYSLLVSLLGYIPVFIGGYLVTNNGKLLNFENDKRTNATNAIIIFIFMDYALNVVTCMLQMIFNVGDIAILVGNLCLSFIWMCVVVIAYMLLNKKTRI